MKKKKLIVLCLAATLAFPMCGYANASAVEQKNAVIEETDSEVVSSGTLENVNDSLSSETLENVNDSLSSETENSSSSKLTGIDWDTVVYVLVNGWDIQRTDWWNPFDNNQDEWAKFNIGTRLNSEDGISVRLNTSGQIYKNNIYWNKVPSTDVYGDEVIASRKDNYPKDGDKYETTAYHKMWDDLGKKRLDETTIKDFDF